MNQELPLIDKIIAGIDKKKADAQASMWNARRHGNFRDAEMYEQWFQTYADALIVVHEVLVEHMKEQT